MIYWKLIFPRILVNLEYMLRERIFRHILVWKITTGLLLNLATGKTVFRFFVSRKTSNLWIWLNPTELGFPEGTKIFINESLCGLWNKCKKLKGMGKLHVFFVSIGSIKSRYQKMIKLNPLLMQLIWRTYFQISISIICKLFVGNNFYFELIFLKSCKLFTYAG